MSTLSPLEYSSGGEAPQAGAGRRKVTAKALRKALKKAGLKTTGKKAALTRRAKKAHLKLRGGADGDMCDVEAGSGKMDGTMKGAKCEPAGMTAGRSRRRRNGLVQGVYRGTTGLAKGSLRQVGRLGRAVFGRGGKVGAGQDDE